MTLTRRRYHNSLPNDLPDSSKDILTLGNIGDTIPECAELRQLRECYDYEDLIAGNIPQDWIDTSKRIFQSYLDRADEDYIFMMLHELNLNCPPAFLRAQKMVDPKYRKYFSRIADGLPRMLASPIVLFWMASKRAGSFKVIQEPIIFEKGDVRVTITGCYLYASDCGTILALISLMRGKKVSISMDGIVYFTSSLTAICAKMKKVNPSGATQHDGLTKSLKRLTECTISWERKDKKGKWRMLHMGHIVAKATALGPGGRLGISFDLDFFKLFDFGYLPVTDLIYELTGEQIEFYVYFITHCFDGVFGGEHGYHMATIYDGCMRGFRKDQNDTIKQNKIEELVEYFELKEVITKVRTDKHNRVKFCLTNQYKFFSAHRTRFSWPEARI